MLFADFLRCGAHCWFHRLARGVQEEFGEPFEDFLDLLGLRPQEVFAGEWDTDVADAAGDFLVRLDRG